MAWAPGRSGRISARVGVRVDRSRYTEWRVNDATEQDTESENISAERQSMPRHINKPQQCTVMQELV